MAVFVRQHLEEGAPCGGVRRVFAQRIYHPSIFSRRRLRENDSACFSSFAGSHPFSLRRSFSLRRAGKRRTRSAGPSIES